MNAVERLVLENMENTNFQCMLQDIFDFVDYFIPQCDLDKSINKEDKE